MKGVGINIVGLGIRVLGGKNPQAPKFIRETWGGGTKLVWGSGEETG